jgi:hypothetical protein
MWSGILLYTLRSKNYEKSGQTLHSQGSFYLFAATMKTQGAVNAGQGSSYTLFAAKTMKTQGKLYTVRYPSTSSQQL